MGLLKEPWVVSPAGEWWAEAGEYQIELSETEAKELRRRAGQYTRPHREVVRAKIVLLAAEGETSAEIARRPDVTERCVQVATTMVRRRLARVG